MGKQPKWRVGLIWMVIGLTLYNILPTIFYYCQPLREKIGPKQAEQIAVSIAERVNHLEEESLEWLASFCDLIQVKPREIRPSDRGVSLFFNQTAEAARFRALLPRAGALIPFVPAQLRLAVQEEASSEVVVQRMVPFHLDRDSFLFAEKGSELYRQIIQERAGRVREILQAGSADSLFSDVRIDWDKEEIELKRSGSVAGQPLIDALARVSQLTQEKVTERGGDFFISFHELRSTTGYLALQLDRLASQQVSEIQKTIQNHWRAKHPDFLQLPIVTEGEYHQLPLEQKTLCLLVEVKDHAPRVVAKGFEKLLSTYEAHPDSEMARQFLTDFQKLGEWVQSFGLIPKFSEEWVFESPGFGKFLLAATRENFLTRGAAFPYALLEVSDREQRILTQNKIEGQIHEDLLKWEDEYRAAQVSLNPHVRYDFPKPSRSSFWNNLTLSLRKFFRGDERKILRWGLDLSGGKTVQIELRDGSGQLVTAEEDLRQGINELYQRVNKMGVSEVAIRQVGHHLVLDFPGSQSLSASELIRSSTMYFHVVNEKFSGDNPALKEQVERFLQEVWNEAVVSGKKEARDLQIIAHRHLQSDAGKALVAQGLLLQDPSDYTLASTLEDTFSKVVCWRGEGPGDWEGQTHPLLIVFRNFAMEGSQLDNIRAGYEPSKGNFLSFEIQNSPDLYAWTSRFSKEKIGATSLSQYSRGNGWRMAVILNDQVISAPALNEPIRDSAMISGHFSQREVNHLASDLKAGSLTFTPHILSEKNVSPELGKTDRMKGISATFFALVLVIGAMVGYYRFAGLIASLAVLFNLLILWAALQNLGATLSLAGIAGVILTVGMAVDANVLVFERIKEEFSLSGNIKAALQAGYQKAYSAIIDSNVTTIIAALILLNFDAGPIKSFAINLIIGIASSMFTALFMTRVYFDRWSQRAKTPVLKMANWIRSTSFDFLKWAKGSFALAALIIGVGCSLIVVQRSHILGMDFTGGYSLHLELEKDNGRESEKVEAALLQAGFSAQEFQVRKLDPSHHVRLLFGPEVAKETLTDALQGIAVPTEWTAMSGQMSDTMRNNALLGLFISFVCIFIYLAFRFEYKFAAAALLCLFHDVLITLGLMGIFHWMGLNIQIDLNTIAAIMTIVGYSLNDTIIIFDRIREEMRLSRGRKMREIVNSALNSTLSRTTITSGTTLLVLLALVAFGGSSIFSFALVMTIGVFFGTLSSWFIAAPLMLFFHGREEKKLVLDRG